MNSTERSTSNQFSLHPFTGFRPNPLADGTHTGFSPSHRRHPPRLFVQIQSKIQWACTCTFHGQTKVKACNALLYVVVHPQHFLFFLTSDFEVVVDKVERFPRNRKTALGREPPSFDSRVRVLKQIKALGEVEIEVVEIISRKEALTTKPNQQTLTYIKPTLFASYPLTVGSP